MIREEKEDPIPGFLGQAFRGGPLEQDPSIEQMVYYFHNDHLGTPQILTDGQAQVVWKADHRPFGEVEVLVEDVENNFRFPGQYFDQETGLHYNYFRDYHPGIGRYLTPDPLGQFSDINLYPYALNAPINWVDSKGLIIDTLADAGFIIWDIYDLIKGDPCKRAENLAALGLDVAGLFIPFATGLGKGYKATKGARYLLTYESKGTKLILAPVARRWRDVATGRFAKGPRIPGTAMGDPSTWRTLTKDLSAKTLELKIAEEKYKILKESQEAQGLVNAVDILLKAKYKK